MTKRIGKNDIIFLAVIIIFAVVFSIIFKIVFSKQGDRVDISVDGKLYGSYSLDTDTEVDIVDHNGTVTNVLIIKNHTADMVEATCPDKLCIKQKAISKDNESIVCLPNKVIATVTSNTKSDIDVISQ